MKRTVGYALFAFVVVSLAFAFLQENRPGPQPQADQPVPVAAEAQAPAGKTPPSAKGSASEGIVIARYCHGHARCSSCIKIEQYSKEAIGGAFRKELDSGKLRFETVNVEEPANRHYEKDYDLYTKSLVLASEAGGKGLRHKVLNEVWEHLDDKDAFMAYVRAETKEFLK